jgi:ribosomal-protein-alanine N-acetyltransferase
MNVLTDTHVRSATLEDRRQLTNLIHFEPYVHRHLDWRPPLDWLGYDPYLIAEQESRLVAALACPPDPPGVAWVRMFAAARRFPPADAWEALWPLAVEQLELQDIASVVAIPLQAWFQRLLGEHGFKHIHDVVMLSWRDEGQPQASPERKRSRRAGPSPEVNVRPMTHADLLAVHDVDAAAFGPIWRNSPELLELAHSQAAGATVAEIDGQIAGYQISTPGLQGAHLARLAVDPASQRRGVGYALVVDLQRSYAGANGHRISVNTQDNNEASLKLYQKAGFRITGEQYPVYQYEIG